MEKKYNLDIRTKARQCLNFVLVICLMGITVPMMFANHIHGRTSPLIGDITILLAFIPTVSAFISFLLYHHHAKSSIVQNDSVDNTPIAKSERLGDIILYIAGIVSIVLIAAFIGLSGGIKNNIMAYYFFFIPSATAVAFTTRQGLWLIGITSMICVAILYSFYYDCCELVEPGKWVYLVFSIYQVFLIVFLEYLTNFLNLYDLFERKLLN